MRFIGTAQTDLAFYASSISQKSLYNLLMVLYSLSSPAKIFICIEEQTFQK